MVLLKVSNFFVLCVLLLEKDINTEDKS